MKATIESTTECVDMINLAGATYRARVWEGITEGGVAFTAYIVTVQVRKDADNAEFERDLQEHKPPSLETIRAIDPRFVL